MSSNKMATKSDLQEMYSRILPYLGGSADAGFTPIGTIIAVFSETAPANYLICDGATYNKADYPELAAHLLALTTHSQYEVSGDSTKFKVPDLRGEFLRGTGTNSHANQGDGAAVGTHQNGTEFPTYWTVAGGNLYLRTGTGADVRMSNVDSQIKHSSTITNVSYAKTGTGETGTFEYKDTARPTNTSVLFCIATKNIYLNPSLDYSTEEKVVGTWIDGKTIYQRTFKELQNSQATTQGSNTTISYDIGVQIDNFVSFDVIRMTGNGAEVACNPQFLSYLLNNGSLVMRQMFVYGTTNSYSSNPNKIVIQNSEPSWNNQLFTVTIRYTKTS